MASPGKSGGFFASVKGALSRRGSNKSSKSTKSTASKQGDTLSSPTNPFFQAAVPTPLPASASAFANTNTAPPPPYSEINTTTGGPTINIEPPTTRRGASPSPSSASYLSAASISTPDDPYAFLSTFDTIFVIDDSGSMAGQSWREVKDLLRAITPICTAHDTNGIDVYFLNARNPSRDAGPAGGWCNVTSPSQVDALFARARPSGGTPTGQRINSIMQPYLRAYERGVAASGDPDASGVKPVNMIVVTDGIPGDDPEAIIIKVAKKLDQLEAPPHQVGIQFFQVGSERGAAQALQELDDGLAEMAGGGDLRDIVDTVTWSGRDGRERALSANGILKVVLGAVVRRLDRRRASGESARPRGNGRLAP
ncbi:collagen alpha-5 chain [Podospora conica]|nr:collagen alpha-5 chain [Schizothecium conicum]